MGAARRTESGWSGVSWADAWQRLMEYWRDLGIREDYVEALSGSVMAEHPDNHTVAMVFAALFGRRVYSKRVQ